MGSIPFGTALRFAAISAVVAALVAAPAHATTIDPLLWQELAESSDFVGVVECDVAGGVVARYKVIETWKGAVEPGATIAIRTATNYWEPQYPLALVGDRFVVTAYKNRAPDTMASTTRGGPVPLWWRKIPADYTLPLFQGAHALGGKETAPYTLGSEHKTIDAQQWKELTGASRKFTIPLAEYFDAEKVTLRVGDLRRKR